MLSLPEVQLKYDPSCCTFQLKNCSLKAYPALGNSLTQEADMKV